MHTHEVARYRSSWTFGGDCFHWPHTHNFVSMPKWYSTRLRRSARMNPRLCAMNAQQAASPWSKLYIALHLKQPSLNTCSAVGTSHSDREYTSNPNPSQCLATPNTMCQRIVSTIKYVNCTATPKHVVKTYTPEPCKNRCGRYEDKHMGSTTKKGGVCPKC